MYKFSLNFKCYWLIEGTRLVDDQTIGLLEDRPLSPPSTVCAPSTPSTSQVSCFLQKSLHFDFILQIGGGLCCFMYELKIQFCFYFFKELGQLEDRPQMLSTTVSERNTSQASEVTDLFQTKISQKHVMC